MRKKKRRNRYMRGLKIHNEMTFSEHKPLTPSLIIRKTNDGKKRKLLTGDSDAIRKLDAI